MLMLKLVLLLSLLIDFHLQEIDSICKCRSFGRSLMPACFHQSSNIVVNGIKVCHGVAVTRGKRRLQLFIVAIGIV